MRNLKQAVFGIHSVVPLTLLYIRICHPERSDGSPTCWLRKRFLATLGMTCFPDTVKKFRTNHNSILLVSILAFLLCLPLCAPANVMPVYENLRRTESAHFIYIYQVSLAPRYRP